MIMVLFLFFQTRVEMHNFLTCMYKEDDARTTLLSAIQVLCHAKTGIDFISRTPVHSPIPQLHESQNSSRSPSSYSFSFCRFARILEDRTGLGFSPSYQGDIEAHESVSRSYLSHESFMVPFDDFNMFRSCRCLLLRSVDISKGVAGVVHQVHNQNHYKICIPQGALLETTCCKSKSTTTREQEMNERKEKE